jgi:ketosteroid isomerase-like protein
MITREQIEKIYKEVQPHFVHVTDADGYASLFTEDAVWWPLGRATRIGPAEIAEGFKEVMAGVTITAVFEAVEINIANAFAYAALLGTETIVPNNGGATQVVHSRELWEFRDVGGAVKISRMIWNQDLSA